jgi:flagellar basal-body rod modification protein FlgD
MNVAPTSTVLPPSAGAASQPPSQELGEQEFLTLLMTQLTNQDPLNPMESTEFMEQIASMNQVQQLMNANDRLDALALGLTSLNNQAAVDLVGKEVVARGNAIQHTEGQSQELMFELGAAAAEVTITVEDEAGEVVWTKTLDQGEMLAGEHAVTWPGDDAPDGDYTFKVVARDAAGEDVTATTYITGLIDELRFDSGVPILMVGGAEVTLDGILRVLQPSQPEPEPAGTAETIIPATLGPEPALIDS